MIFIGVLNISLAISFSPERYTNTVDDSVVISVLSPWEYEVDLFSTFILKNCWKCDKKAFPSNATGNWFTHHWKNHTSGEYTLSSFLLYRTQRMILSLSNRHQSSEIEYCVHSINSGICTHWKLKSDTCFDEKDFAFCSIFEIILELIVDLISCEVYH